jgi:hypothetical protein
VSSKRVPPRSAKITPSQRPAADTGTQQTVSTPPIRAYRAGTQRSRSPVTSTTRSSDSATWAIGVSSSVPYSS